MKDIFPLLDDYATALKVLSASAYILEYCGTDMHTEYNVLKQLKQIYLTNQVLQTFKLFYFLQINIYG